MTKRWIIRSLFLLPVVFCLAGWGWSGWYDGWASYTRGHRWVGLGTVDGAIHLAGGWYPSLSDGYDAFVYRNESARFWPAPFAERWRVLGFRWLQFSGSRPGGPVMSVYALGVPYWFPLLVSALLLLGAWRKTRYRPDPATAFPVVLGGTRSAED